MTARHKGILHAAWAALFLTTMVFVIHACYRLEQARDGARTHRYVSLVVHNLTAGVVRVEDTHGRSFGRITSGTGTVVLRGLSTGASQVVIRITGDTQLYPTPPQNLWERDCWEVDVEVMDPGGSIWRTFLPCGMRDGG